MTHALATVGPPGKNFVRDAGPLDAEILIVGEAPGRTENASRLPFMGWSGTVLSGWLAKAGLRRVNIRITNVYPWQPKDNIIKSISDFDLAYFGKKLHERIAEMPNLRVIVPMSNTALEALLGVQQISARRGSIYSMRDANKRTLKVIPTLHPAATAGTPMWQKRCILDWQRIAREVRTTELDLPKRTHIVHPTMKELEIFREHTCYIFKDVPIAIDLETPIKYRTVTSKTKTGRKSTKRIPIGRFIGCVGFANRKEWSITIPTTRAYWGDQLNEVWDIIEEICDAPCEKIFQNGWFDTYHLKMERNITVRNWKWDTKPMHQTLDPWDEHSLAYMASIHTREPYWKDEGHREKGVPKNIEEWWTYCGKDCCLTWELHEIFKAKLEAAGRMDFYLRHYRNLFRPVAQMQVEGIRTNPKRRVRNYEKQKATCVTMREKIEAKFHVNIFGAKGAVSPKKLGVLLYETLGVPERLKRNAAGEMARTTNELTVRKIQLAMPKRKDIQLLAKWVLLHRRASKLSTFFAETVVDEDNRFRSQYGTTPYTGRLSSGKNPYDTGGNAQNQDRESRDFFVPDRGHVFVEGDLSQAESRLVYMLTRDTELVELARTPPWEFDVHRLNAAMIFGVEEEDVDSTMRFLGKKTVHASHYDEQGQTMSDSLLVDGFVYTAVECQQKINKYMEWRSPIRTVFQREVRKILMKDRAISNSWGRTVSFLYARLGPEIFRKGYAFRPQSEVADLVNRWGFIPLWRHIRKQKMAARIRQQGHDSLLVSCPREEVWEVMSTMRRTLERPRSIGKLDLTIPVEFKVGTVWSTKRAMEKGSVIEFKQPPTRTQLAREMERFAV